jgi:mRNA interferase MazF
MRTPCEFEVQLPDGLPVTGVVLSDHVKSADWQVRHAEYAGIAPGEVLDEVRARLNPLFGM